MNDLTPSVPSNDEGARGTFFSGESTSDEALGAELDADFAEAMDADRDEDDAVPGDVTADVVDEGAGI
jgi:hypothetical protein